MKYCVFLILSIVLTGCSGPQTNDAPKSSTNSPKEDYNPSAGELLIDNTFEDSTVLKNSANGLAQPQVNQYIVSADPQDVTKSVLRFSEKGFDFQYVDLPFRMNYFTLTFLVKVTNGNGSGYVEAPNPDYPIVTLRNGIMHRSLGITYSSNKYTNNFPMLSFSENGGAGTSAQLTFNQWYLVVAKFEHNTMDTLDCETFDLSTRNSINGFTSGVAGLDLSIGSETQILFGYTKRINDATIKNIFIDNVRLYCGDISYEYLLSQN